MHSINEKISDLLNIMHFGVKNRFSKIVKFLRICWSDLIDSIGFLEAVDMDKLPILSRNYFKWPLNLKIFSILKIKLSVLDKGKTYVLLLRFLGVYLGRVRPRGRVYIVVV